MKAVVAAVGLALMLMPAGASAQPVNATEQQLQGQWVSDYTQNGIPFESVVTITGHTYIATQAMYSAGVLYQTTQTGEIFLTPPDSLNLAVTDFYPKETNGYPNSMPPNTFWKIFVLTPMALQVAEPGCLNQAPREQCLVSFKRRQ